MNLRGHSLIRDLTESHLHGSEVLDALRRFASEFGWRPSDQIDRYRGTESFCNGHLVVEHGFDLTAVISFVRTETPYPDLSMTQRHSLLELSYNNLVDWHLLPERSGMRVIFNRTDPPKDTFFPATASDDVWRADAFDKLTGRKPSPNVRALDDALISTVSFWKRAVATDLGSAIGLSNIASLINSVILARALEDYRNRGSQASSSVLVDQFDQIPAGHRTAKGLILAALGTLGQGRLPDWLTSELDSLEVFDGWNEESLRDLVRDFYRSRFSPYRYNFHLISKHALSRIYEHYVSVLRDSGDGELALFRDLPTEIRNKDLGSVYTPQYIARFFARYLKEHRTPHSFRRLRTIDPACGSGMFLRTLLEMQCDPADDGFSANGVKEAFARTTGLDIDPNACQATKLSLALLHLVLAGEFPRSLGIEAIEAIQYLQDRPDELFDVVIANPPFVKWDGLSDAMRERISGYMRNQGLGKQDMYLAFLKAAIEHLAPGGLMCFVLPHSFLLSASAARIRREIASTCAIRVIADLSEIPVFEGMGAYVILLIAERTPDRSEPAMVARCQEFVGHALQDTVEGRVRVGDGYEVFAVEQRTFAKGRWQLLRADESTLSECIEAKPTLAQFLDVRQGMVTGADDVFVRPLRECAKAERAVWRPLLADREMERFVVPSRVSNAVFYPFDDGGRRLSEVTLRKTFKETWKYLQDFRGELSGRSSVRAGHVKWWEPERPRSPEKLFVPKIVTPHLVLVPKFAVDDKGRYAVSRSPYLVSKGHVDGVPVLKLLMGVLNSAIGHWQLAASSHKYSRGYLMLEVKTLRELRVPNPAQLPPALTRRILSLVDRLSELPGNPDLGRDLDAAIGEAYGLSKPQMQLIGAGGN
jgi:hypothetical protein